MTTDVTTGRRLKDAAKLGVRRAFEVGQRVGVDVLPRHFYSAIPDIAALRSSTTWRTPRSMIGVEGLDADRQLDRLSSWFDEEVRGALAAHDVHALAVADNRADGYGPSEARILHALVASQRPRRVVQVGAGVSTAVVLRAAQLHDVDVEVVCVDPYPTDYLVELAAAGRITLHRERAQDVALEVLTGLAAGDLLFVDSTHTVKPDSEVNRLVLEVLPRLAEGVQVHFHDIWFPYDYPRDLLEETLFFWNESALLHAFLVDNRRYRVAVSGSWLHYTAQDRLRAIVPDYEPEADVDGLRVDGAPRAHFPGSTYLEVVAPR